MTEFHQRHGLSIQIISFSAPSKTAKLASAALFIAPFSNSPSPLVLFPSLQHAFETTDFQGWPHCSFLILPFFPAHSEVCCLTPANMQQALMWNCTDLGQRLISLSLLTNPGLRVCVLLAGRHLWFNTTPPDMTSNQRQRLCDTVHLYIHLFILQQPINHTWTIWQQKRDGSKFRLLNERRSHDTGCLIRWSSLIRFHFRATLALLNGRIHPPTYVLHSLHQYSRSDTLMLGQFHSVCVKAQMVGLIGVNNHPFWWKTKS